ncbi:MAG: hypothetical protein IJX99_01720 [Clostridia bacterium]|nr:hypothetical protein [Clostridia bacterium]
MKKFLVSFFIAVSFFSTVVYAGTLVKKVYFSPYPILIDNEEYSSETPILQYQDRTYVALREFSEMVGVDVDFVNGKIIINTEKMSGDNQKEETKKKEEYIVVEIKKEEVVENSNSTIVSDATNEVASSATQSNTRMVYVSKTGKKYHNLSNCNGAEYTGISISEALSKGCTPCLRCANVK